jgi:hypothetical protein
MKKFRADVAQLVEHSLGKGEVTGSIPVISSRNASDQWSVISGQRAQRIYGLNLITEH